MQLSNRGFAVLAAFLMLLLVACEASWDDRARQAVFAECLKSHQEKPDGDRQRYCSCFTRSVEQQYKSPEILEADPALFTSLVFDCKDTAKAFVVDWPDSVKDKFLSTCVEAAIWRNIKDPTSYCICMMERGILAMHGNKAGPGLDRSNALGSATSIGLDCQKATQANIDSIIKVGMPKSKPDDPKTPGMNNPQGTKKEVELNPF